MNLKKAVVVSLSIVGTIAGSGTLAWAAISCYNPGTKNGHDPVDNYCKRADGTTLASGGLAGGTPFVHRFSAGRDITVFGYNGSGGYINNCYAQVISPTNDDTGDFATCNAGGVEQWDMYGKDFATF